MKNAKCVWLLSNGEIVSVGDNVQIDNGRAAYSIIVADVGENYITGKISTGGEFDAYFEEIKDIRVIK